MDFDFALIGSIAALDKVYFNYYKILKKSKAEKIKELELSQKERIVNEQISINERQKKNTSDSLKKLEEKVKKERNLMIDNDIISFNSKFTSNLEDTKPKFNNGKIVTSDSILFKGRFNIDLSFDISNKLGFENDEIIGFYNYFINDSIKILRKDKILLINRYENPFGPGHIAHDLYQEMKKRWSNYEKEYLLERNNEFKKLKLQEFKRIAEYYQNYKPQKNRTDLDFEISKLFLENNFVFNLYISPNDSKPNRQSFTNSTNVKILNDYKAFKFRINYDGKIGYLDFFEVSKVIDIEYLRPFLNFWYNYYN
jgi:hypothetical protein